jgi:hypothetical protein
MATSRGWRSWYWVAEWPPDVRPELKAPVTAFLDRVQAGIAQVEAAFGADCTNGDVITLLVPELWRLADVTDPSVSDVRAMVRSRWGEDAPRDRREAWVAAVDAVCASEAAPVQTAIVCLLLERVVHATLAEGDARATVEELIETADLLASQTRQVLLAVLQRVVSPADYQTM